MPKTPSKPTATDWDRVKREAAQDGPIAHTAADGPYDPNDAAAVAAWQARRLAHFITRVMPRGARFKGLTSALRLCSVALLGTALTLTTTQSDLLQVLEWLLAPLARLGLRVDLLALQLALMLRFTEHFFILWKRLDEAHRLRTGRAGGWRILAPLIIQTLVSARRVADTLHVRLGP